MLFRSLAGFLIAAPYAAIMSTVAANLLIVSSSLVRDIYQRFINPGVSQEAIVRFQRVWIALLGIIAFVLANFFKSILDMAFTSYTMVGAGLTPALLAAFLWKRATVQGGVSSIVAGMGVTVLITLLNAVLHEPLLETDYIILPAAAASLFCLFVVSWMTPPSPEEKWKPFMENNAR